LYESAEQQQISNSSRSGSQASVVSKASVKTTSSAALRFYIQRTDSYQNMPLAPMAASVTKHGKKINCILWQTYICIAPNKLSGYL